MDNEWQPAIIAPFDPLHPGITHPEDWKAVAGKKIRVRPGPDDDVYGCGISARRFQVHPDDALLIGCPFEERESAFLCEHMILTD